MVDLGDKESERIALKYGVKFGLFFAAAIVSNAPGVAPKDMVIAELLLELSNDKEKIEPIMAVVLDDLKNGKSDGKKFIQLVLDILGIKQALPPESE